MVEPTYTPRQQVALALVPKFTAALSCIGSGWIILEVLRDRRKRGLVYHRLLLVMSIGDCLLSAGLFLSTWPMPADTPDVYGAVGNTMTCTAQGFLIQFGWTSQLYQAFLAIYYVLTLRYNWKEGPLRKLERIAHGFTLLFALCTSIAGIPLELYNSALFWCWIAKFPKVCEDSRKGGESNIFEDNDDGDAITCIRGNNAWIYRIAFWYVWLWLASPVILAAMCLVYCTVHQQAKKIKKYGGGGWIEQNKAKVARQAIYYAVTFFLLTCFNSVLRVLEHSKYDTPFVLAILMTIFTPIQGVWNGVIYLRPRYISYKQKHPDWSLWRRVKAVLMKAVATPADANDDDHELGMISSRNLEGNANDDFRPDSI